MVSIRDLAAVAAVVAIATGLSGCTSFYDAARNLALQGVAARLQTLETKTEDFSGAPQVATVAARVRAGELAPYLSDTATPLPAVAGGFGYAIYDVTVAHGTARYDAAAWATGEGGGGFTGDIVSVYVCVTAVVGKSDLTQKSFFREVRCRKDVASLVGKQQGALHVKLSEVPGYN